MRTARMAAIVALLSGTMAWGFPSRIVYTLELGGNDHADQWEANTAPTFTPGVTSGAPITVGNVGNQDLTWAVRVSVGGVHEGTAGAAGVGKVALGAANLVFDLEVYDSAGNLVTTLGAAPLVASGTNNVPDPATPGFWSAINDGDTNGARGAISPDILANAAFAISIHNGGDAPPAQMRSLIDPVSPAPSGPNFDYGWYPTANGRSGVDIAGTKSVVAVNNPSLGGKLVGFGAGYKSYDYTSYRPGVGKYYFSDAVAEFGFGAFVDDMTAGSDDPLNPPAGVVEKALFEGQLSVRGLAAGTYTLKVVPSVDGNNILHGDVVWDSTTPNYNAFGSFAVKANEVYPTAASNPGMQFVVVTPPPPTSIAARKIFYNQSYYDGNKVAIDAAPIAGVNNDDYDAVDTSKSPLIAGAATFANWTGYDKGINGLIYDINQPSRAPVVTDFDFRNIGKAGTTSPGTAMTPSAFVVQDLGSGNKRVIITFANGTLKSTWLKITIGTGFGLAAADVHYWGNAVGDSGNDATPNILVNAADELGSRNNPKTIFSRATVDFRFDYNKDSLVNAADELISRQNPTTIFNCVKFITK